MFVKSVFRARSDAGHGTGDAVRGTVCTPRWVWIGAAGLVAGVAMASGVLPLGDLLYRENGVLETVSLGLWVLSCLAAWSLASWAGNSTDRLMGLWTGWLAALAALRELDAHVLLNPKYLGDLGVRFRVDWWLSGEVSLWLKLGWGLLALSAAATTICPLFKLRRALCGRVRGGDPVVRLLLVAVGFLAVGYMIDDFLRPVRSVSSGSKRLVEETSELIGAAIYLGAVVWQWRRARNSSRQGNQTKEDLKGLGLRRPEPGC